MYRYVTLFLLLAAVHTLHAHPNLMLDEWKDDKAEAPAGTLRNWIALSDPDTGVIVRRDGRTLLRLERGGRVRSMNLAPYLPRFTLEGTLRLTDGRGAVGLGFIDFSSNVYYYLYADANTGKAVLQRGDGIDTVELASVDFSPGSNSHTYALEVDMSEDKQITLNGRIGDTTLSGTESLPANMGSVFYVYLGSSNDSTAEVSSLTTVRRPRR